MTIIKAFVKTLKINNDTISFDFKNKSESERKKLLKQLQVNSIYCLMIFAFLISAFIATSYFIPFFLLYIPVFFWGINETYKYGKKPTLIDYLFYPHTVKETNTKTDNKEIITSNIDESIDRIKKKDLENENTISESLKKTLLYKSDEKVSTKNIV